MSDFPKWLREWEFSDGEFLRQAVVSLADLAAQQHQALEAASGRLLAASVYVAKPDTEQSNDERYAEALEVWARHATDALRAAEAFKEKYE